MMDTALGRTGLRVNKDAFGALPLQRVEMREAISILQKALDGGINFFDTARGYTDSEEKIGAALASRRNEFVLASKTPAKNAEDFWPDLEASLKNLKTDHIDIFQFHNPPFVPCPGDGTGLYEAMEKAKKQGKIRFIGITNHRLPLARDAVDSGLYDSLQFPFSYLSNEDEIELTRLCAQKNMGFIAMKALSGGLITDIRAARSWLTQFVNVVPIWGIQRETELDELFSAMKEEAPLDAARKERVARDRKELSGAFCRGCGYCLPCAAKIQINTCARIPLLLRRSPTARWLSDDWKKEMDRINDCKLCGQCVSRCPYSLDPPALLKKSYEEYKKFLAGSLPA
jgi:predicted aldo/keto reductase-like oxidoreductase